jgi:hypothetical protein
MDVGVGVEVGVDVGVGVEVGIGRTGEKSAALIWIRGLVRPLLSI